MKQLLILCAFILASLQLQASHLASELNLKLYDLAWFTLTLDNHIIDTPINNYQTSLLEPGNHYLMVTRLDNGYYGPHSVSHKIFAGYVFIPSGSRVRATIDRYGRFSIDNITAMMPSHLTPIYACAPVPTSYYAAISEYEFQLLINTIERLSFESSKFKVIKQALSVNKVTSRQVAALIDLMTFESTKLDLAKFAYPRTIDKRNYFMINDSFTFESSITDLNEFIYPG